MRFDRNLAVNLGLLALALSTALFLFTSRERPTREERDARASNLVPIFRADRLRKVVVERGVDSLVLAVRAAPDAGSTEYRLGQRGETEADPAAARSFLRALELASFLRELEAEGADRKALGLARPRARFKLDFGAVAGELTIGNAALTPKDTTYVEVRGFGAEPRLGLARSGIVEELLVTEHALRPQWLVPYGPSELLGLRLYSGSAPALKLEKRGPAFYVAGGERVNRDVTDRLLLELSRARAERPLAEDSSLFSPEVSLRAEFLATERRPSVLIELGGACPGANELIAFRRTAPTPSRVCVSAGVRQNFLELLANLRDRSAFALHGDEVESFSLEREGKRLAFRRSGHAFELEAPSTGQVELTVGNQLLDALVEVKGSLVDTPDLLELGFQPAAGSVRLTSSAIEGAPAYEERVELGRVRSDGALPLRRTSDGAVLLVPRDAARVLAPDSSQLRGRRLLDFGPSELKTLSLSSGGLRQRLRRTENGVFELLEPPGFEHDAELVLDIVQALGTLQAERWVADRDDGSFGLRAPTVLVEAELLRAGAASSIRLTVGAETTGGYFGQLDTKPGVFVLPKSFVHDLTTPLLSRSVFIVDLAGFDAIVFDFGNRRLSLDRRGDTFQPRAGSPELAPAAIERLLARLTSLRAEAALHAGPPRKAEGFERPALRVQLVAAKGAAHDLQLLFGSESSYRGTSIRFARRADVDATYGVLESAVREIMEAL
jgi:hypothetical protein